MTKKILAIPKGFFGDMVLTTPVFEAFRRGAPGVHVTVVVPPSVLPLAKSDPYIDDVIVFDRRKDYPGWGGLRASARERI